MEKIMRLAERSRPDWRRLKFLCIWLAVGLLALPAGAQTVQQDVAGSADGIDRLKTEKPEVALVEMNSARGRALFVSKGCVICHSVNGVGGATGPSLDAHGSLPKIDVFDFAARMWRGAEVMLAFQKLELGYQILLTGSELADITAFAHDRREQEKLREADIPPEIRRLMRFRRI
jgi:cytochrome c